MNILISEEEQKRDVPTYNEIIEIIKDDSDDELFSWKIHYNSNYTKQQLTHIAKYYEISTRKLKKHELIDTIIFFERDPINEEIVFIRKKLWGYIEDIQNDNYLSKFLIIKI